MDSIHEFGENIDQYGRKELPFTIEKLPESPKFALTVDYNYSTQAAYKYGVANANSSSYLWYRKNITQIMEMNETKRRRGGTINTSPQQDTTFQMDHDVTIEQENAGVASSSTALNQTTDEHASTRSDEDTNLKVVTSKQQLNKDCLDFIQKNSPLIANSLAFLFDNAKREEFFKLLSSDGNNETIPPDAELRNSLSRFILLYVPLDYMKHLSVQIKLNLITQFLLTNKTDESKIELIIDLANYYARKQEWNLVLELLNNCTQDNEELVDANSPFLMYYMCYNLEGGSGGDSQLFENNFNQSNIGGASQQQQQKNASCSEFLEPQNQQTNFNAKLSQKDMYNLYDHACVCLAFQEAKENDKSYTHLFKMKNFLRQIRAIFGLMYLWSIDGCLEMIDFCLTKSKLYEQPLISNANADLEYFSFNYVPEITVTAAVTNMTKSSNSSSSHSNKQKVKSSDSSVSAANTDSSHSNKQKSRIHRL